MVAYTWDNFLLSTCTIFHFKSFFNFVNKKQKLNIKESLLQIPALTPLKQTFPLKRIQLWQYIYWKTNHNTQIQKGLIKKKLHFQNRFCFSLQDLDWGFHNKIRPEPSSSNLFLHALFLPLTAAVFHSRSHCKTINISLVIVHSPSVPQSQPALLCVRGSQFNEEHEAGPLYCSHFLACQFSKLRMMFKSAL